MSTGWIPRPYIEETDWQDPAPPLMTIVFGQYRGRSYQQAVLTAQQAALYKEYSLEKSTYHVAAFQQAGSQAALAHSLLQLTMGIKGVLLFGSDGVLLPSFYKAMMVVECYQSASLVRDHRAYCHAIINDPFLVRGSFEVMYSRGLTEDRYVLPCRLINPTYLEFDAQHPASPEDLMQAAAVKQGSYWCPYFSAREFRKISSDHDPYQGQRQVLD